MSDSFAKMKYCSVHITDFRNFLNLGEDAGEKKIPKNQFKTVEVVFDHVTFCYKGAEKPVLHDISFSLKSGEHKALVGLNGAGKSTLVKLISGLYLPTKGTIYVNGIDTRELDRKKYYEHEAAVFQDTFTLTYSVAENVALNEQWDEKKVWECLEKAGLMQKVKALPRGLDTNLGKELSQDGVKLSGGETQKLFLSDLLFVESDNHYLTLHTAAGTETFKKNLSEFREELSAAWQASGGTGECFAAAHRSYLVNLAHVERITRTECLLSDGTKIPVSRGCYASLNQVFLQFYRPNAF